MVKGDEGVNALDPETNGASNQSPQNPAMPVTFTAGIARWSARNKWITLAASAVAIVLAVLSIMFVGTEMRDDDGGVGDSGKAYELRRERFKSAPAPTPAPGERHVATRLERLVVSNLSLDAEHTDFKRVVDGLIEKIRALPGVGAAGSFYDSGDPTMLADDRRAVLGFVQFEDESVESGSQIDIGPAQKTVDEAAAATAGFEIELYSFRLINDEIDEILTEDFNRILFLSMGIGLLILVLAFRALVAAIIPLLMAIASIFTAIGVAAVVSQAYALVELYAEMVLLMGLAVGIDYSLFIVSRFRTERAAGREKLEAITVASNTTGRAVFYAGITVILSLTGLMLTRDFTFISMALGAIIVVFIAVIGSLTLLPALLSVLGDHLNRLAIPYLGRSPDRGGNDDTGGIWGRIADVVLKRPAILAAITVSALIALGLPVTALNLGFNAGADSLPDAARGKRALELLEIHFTSSLIQPALIVIDAGDVDGPEVQAAVAALMKSLEEGKAFLGPFDSDVNNARDTLVIKVPVAGKIDNEVSENAVKLLREEVIPEAFSGLNNTVYVTGDTAESLDFTSSMYHSAPVVFGFVLCLSFLLLLVMFRSIVIPIKAIVLNLLSVAAAYGVLVMVFQWGWGIEILGSEESGVIEAWLPLFLFGILFGLSMDYHMLLLSRIKEIYDDSGQNVYAVSSGIRLTAGQITSAAAIMVGVFLTFATSRILGLQQFGVGLAVAVLIDATVIRVVLLPAGMKLLGDWNWYLPVWLEWLPKVSPQGQRDLPVTPAAD
ncbi:MAG: MMPL family transporter [Chloroflexi bacterium]|nr:MMPL family transporter [Chloroflexota bacterium]